MVRGGFDRPFSSTKENEMAYDNTNRGVMFKNEEKNTDRHPDYKGSLDVGGSQYWISGWIKTAGPNSQNPGSKFLSISIEPKEARKPARQQTANPAGDFDNSDIPF